MERIKATYLIETPLHPEKAAAILAGEQSSGTFVAVPGETEELKQRFAARVESVELLESVASPSLPAMVTNAAFYNRACIQVSWSIENFGYNIPAMVSTLQGNLYELRQFTGLKLMRIDLPDSFGKVYKGPSFGVEGCRKAVGVYDRPLIGTIIKPSIGLTPETTAEMVKVLAAADIDFIKDDELIVSSGNSPFEARVDAILEVLHNHANLTGKLPLYAFNLSGSIDDMCRHYDYILEKGGTACMISINSVGWAGVEKLAGLGKLVIHGHRNGWGMMTRHPLLGIDFKAYEQIARLLGIDQLHVNGIDNKFWESNDSVVASMNACLQQQWNHRVVMPVVSSGQWGGQAFETYKRVPTTDLLYMAGGGIVAHPMGAAAGVKAIRQAWQAAVAGLTLEQAAGEFPEFKMAVEKFDQQ
jgi:ribulose-bisphosphate carboxylase large chain